MRVLMVHPHDVYSPSEPWTVRIEHLARELAARGHEVRLVYFPLDMAPHELHERDHPDGYRTIPLCRWRKTLFTNLRALRPLAEWAEVVHLQKCHSWAALPAIYGAFRAGRPLHYDWDDWELAIYNYSPPSTVGGWSLALFEGLLPALASSITVASRALHELAVVEHGVDEALLFDGHVGADTDRFRPDLDGGPLRARLGLPDGPLVLYLGQLHGAQYAELFLHAARQLLDLRPPRDAPTFALVGQGGRLPELRALTETLGLSRHVHFPGSIDHDDVPRMLAAADVVVACFCDNAQQRTKSPLKIAEYMACGKAIVASEMGEVPRMLGDTGLLVPPGNALAMAQAVGRLLDDPQLAAEKGRAARARALARFDWRVTASNLLDAYAAGRWDRERQQIGLWGRLRRFVGRNRDVIGVLDGQRTFTGPEAVQLDLTDHCNSDCIGCWTHSPLVTGGTSPARAELPYEIVEPLIRELADLGTRQLWLSGGGDPTVHPRWLDVLQQARDVGLWTAVNTNATLLEGATLERLLDVGCDLLIASLWAADAPTYAATHPASVAETYHAVCATLRQLCRRKPPGMRVRVYHVLSPLNVHQLEAMVAQAAALGADEVELAPTDTIPGKTDQLLLTPEQLAEARAALQRVLAVDWHNVAGHRMTIYDAAGLAGRLTSPGAAEGRYDQTNVNPRGCYVGWTFARIHADGHVAPCLKCHRYSLGNVREQTFRQIWTGAPQRRFRAVARRFEQADPFFQLVGNDPAEPVGCYKSCDDRGRNHDVQARLDHLGRPKRWLLRAAGWGLRAGGRSLGG